MVVGRHLLVRSVLHDLQTPEAHGHGDKGDHEEDAQPRQSDLVGTTALVRFGSQHGVLPTTGVGSGSCAGPPVVVRRRPAGLTSPGTAGIPPVYSVRFPTT